MKLMGHPPRFCLIGYGCREINLGRAGLSIGMPILKLSPRIMHEVLRLLAELLLGDQLYSGRTGLHGIFPSPARNSGSGAAEILAFASCYRTNTSARI